MDNLDRYDELSIKLLKIGEALLMEGEEKGDFNILSTGNFLIFISSLIYDIDDVKLFSEMCEMMAAKKMMDGSEIMGLINDLSFLELQELIKKIMDKRDE
jgi:hypothetical protein